MPYDKLQPLPVVDTATEEETIGLTGGFVGEVSPKRADLSRSPSLNAIRFQGESIRKQFGYTHIGLAAPYRVLGLIEHKFIRFQSTFVRLCRLMRDNDTQLRLEVWDGAQWVFVDSTEELIDEVYISHISIQGALLMAEGNYIFIWEETFDPVSVVQGWPDGNLLNAPGEFTTIIVDPNNALDGAYVVGLTVTIRGASTAGITVTVGVVHNGDVIATRDFFAPATEDEAAEVVITGTISFTNTEINQYDLLHLRLISMNYESIPEGELSRSVQFSDSAPVAAMPYSGAVYVNEGRVIQMSLSGTIMPDENPEDNTWTIKGGLRFSDASIGRARTRLLLWRDALAAWETLDEQMYEVSATFPVVSTIIDDFEFVWINPGLPIQPLDIFRIEGSWEPTGPPTDPIQAPDFVGYLPPLAVDRLPKPMLEWSF